MFVNDKFCKDPQACQSRRFLLFGPQHGQKHIQSSGSTVTPTTVAQILGLNTLGISLVRIAYAPNGGLTPPHTHPYPRATELLLVVEGTLSIGFVTSNPENRLNTSHHLTSRIIRTKKYFYISPQQFFHQLISPPPRSCTTCACNLAACNPMKRLLPNLNPQG
ncbi:Germin-like protein subfamily 1 member 14 [Hibiscus syriacus]|uniref:Germin-like protein subfamily 1 member 14 n=1 Tax=Hibiscus syriacus TaxID=106335 RepID=A0A6A2Y415_HIBSY|nr:Germin-like protein subfamily 1 member 14 [Hibiscus syriacus]